MSEGFVAPDAVTSALLLALGRGRARAVPAKDLAARIGLTERNVRAAIEQLRRAGYLVGSASSGERPGFYLIITREELEDTARHMTSRARHIFTTVSAMRRAAQIAFGLEGARLFDVEPYRLPDGRGGPQNAPYTPKPPSLVPNHTAVIPTAQEAL